MSVSDRDGAAEFFEDLVFPVVRDFLQSRSDLQKARIACILLSCMKDYYFIYRKGGRNLRGNYMKNLKEFGEKLNSQYWGLAIVNDLAIATKHAFVFNPQGGRRHEKIVVEQLSVANMTCESPVEGLDIFAQTGSGDESVSLAWLLEGVVNWWRSELQKSCSDLPSLDPDKHGQ